MKFKNIKKIIVDIIGYVTHCYNYGKNNKLIFIKDGKEYKKIFMPRGLTIIFVENNNEVRIEQPLKFKNTLIYMEGNDGFFSIKKSKSPVRGAQFFMENNSQIIIGENCQLKNRGLYVIANCYYEKPTKVVIGNNVLIGKNTTIRTSDGHTLINPTTGESLNRTKDVIIDDNVWIGTNCTLLKGTHIPRGSVVGACSLVTKNFDEENILIAGNPAKVIRRDVTWNIKGYGKYTRIRDKQLEGIENG